MQRSRRSVVTLSSLAVVTALGLTAVPSILHAQVRWPSRDSRTNVADPIRALRWVGGETVWISGTPTRVTAAINDLKDRQNLQPTNARWVALEAIAQRAGGNFDAASAALERAMTMDARVINEPDVAITQAYLLARKGLYTEAVVVARRVLPRLGVGTVTGIDLARNELALEISRWSMARGRDGLRDAVAVLYEVTALGVPVDMVRATLALALARSGSLEQAREVARGGDLPSSYRVTPLRGALLPTEIDAAVGVSFWLTGDIERARPALTTAAQNTTGPWKDFQTQLFQQVSRQTVRTPAAGVRSPMVL